MNPVKGEPTSLVAARLWMPVNRDWALARLERGAADMASSGLPSEWFDVIADAALDGIRDDPRFQELDARFGL